LDALALRPLRRARRARARRRGGGALSPAVGRTSVAARRAAALALVVTLTGCAAVVHAPPGDRRPAERWSEMRRGPSGQAPDPATAREPVIQVYAARALGWRGVFAVHPWIVVKPSGAETYRRYEVIGWGVDAGAPAIRIDRAGPDDHWFGARPELLVDARGDGVDALVAKVEAAVAAYPYRETYRTGPGAWASRRRPHAKHVEGRHRPREAAERQLAERLDLHQVLDRGVEPARDEDLAAARLAAQPRGEVGHGADRPVVPAPLEADGAERRVALRDADAEVQVEAQLAPAARQGCAMRCPCRSTT